MKERWKFVPEVGTIYENHGGGTFKCLSVSGYNATFKNTKSGWTFFAHVCHKYADGRIDWDYSTGGRFI